MIPGTRTFLPPIDEYQSCLREIWKTNQVANGEKFLFELEKNIKKHLPVPNIVLTTNGTLPLQINVTLCSLFGQDPGWYALINLNEVGKIFIKLE